MNVCTHPSCADGCFYVFKGCVIVAYICLDSVGSGLDGIKSAENSVGRCSDGIWYENPFVRTASRGIRASEQRLSGQTGLDFFGGKISSSLRQVQLCQQRIGLPQANHCLDTFHQTTNKPQHSSRGLSSPHHPIPITSPHSPPSNIQPLPTARLTAATHTHPRAWRPVVYPTVSRPHSRTKAGRWLVGR